MNRGLALPAHTFTRWASAQRGSILCKCSQLTEPTLVLHLEAGGDQRWGLTSDPCGERFAGLDLVVLNHLNLKSRERLILSPAVSSSKEETFTPHTPTHTQLSTSVGEKLSGAMLMLRD